MSWSDELLPMLRAMVADDGAVQKFSDSQLETLVTTAARAVIFDGAQVGFAYPFSASVENQTITPDPTSSATLDDSFLYLVAAKATCILSRGALSKAAGQAIKIRSKDDELDLPRPLRRQPPPLVRPQPGPQDRGVKQMQIGDLGLRISD